MFKKICIFLVLAIGIFSTVAFAETKESSKKYYISIGRDKWCFDEIEYSLDNGLLVFKLGTYDCYSDGVWSYNLKPNTVTTANKVTATNHSGFRNFVGANGYYTGSDYVPPMEAPAMETVQEIPTHLLAQLKILLPVGVLILSIMLGVSLVPRLVHLFL